MSDINENSSVKITPYTDALEQLLPYRYKRGFSGALTLFTFGITSDLIRQIQDDSLFFQFIEHPNSPSDYLRIAGEQFGIIRYIGDTDDSFRERLKQRWTIVPKYGQEESLKEAIRINLDPDGTKGVTVNILFDFGANGSPVSPPKPGGFDIPTYPASSAHKSQFIVSVNATTQLALPGQTQNLSNVISDIQLETIRNIIKQTKPAQFICREIIIYSLTVYDGSGLIYDGSFNYLDLENLDSVSDVGEIGYIFERHRGY